MLVDVGAPNLCGYLKDVVLNACDEACGKRGEAKDIHIKR